MSQIQFGLPLTQPSTQSLIPVLDTYGRAYGFFPIQSTAFQGTETTFALASGTVAITTVTLPQGITDKHNLEPVPQYMAAVYQPAQVSLLPWRGFPEFVTSENPQTIGFFSWHSMPTRGWFHHFGAGTFIDSLKFNMNKYVFVPPPPQGNPVAANGTLRWACTANQEAFTTVSTFVDFNWVDLFSAALKTNPQAEGQQIIPLSIATTSNPAGGFFKASAVQALGAQVTYLGGVQMFNTIRILRLQDPPAGVYNFAFAIADNLGNTTDVTLALTVV